MGQWLRHIWYSGRFQHQRYAVRIQSLTKFISPINCIEKTKIKKKEAGNGPLKNLWMHVQ